jgi:GNAT superfamily N-acetyltransferase
MHYELMKPGEEFLVSVFVWQVFEEFEAPEYSQEGIDEFLSYIAPQKLAVRYVSNRFFILCCKDSDELVGIVAIRDGSHISLLFVDKQWHRHGIARQLLKLAVEKCLATNSDLQSITVNSSPYAVAIYERLGFKKTGNEQVKNGIRFTPMRLMVSEK